MTTALRRRLLEPVWSPKRPLGLVGWWDASTIAGLDDAAAVGQWNDLSGKGNHAVQATGSKKPLFKRNVIGGQPGIRFDGVDDFLAAPLISAALSYTAFVVMTTSALPSTWAEAYAIWNGDDATGSTGWGVGHNSAGNRLVRHRAVNNAVDGALTLGVPEIRVATRNPVFPLITMHVNGVLQALTNSAMDLFAATTRTVIGYFGDVQLNPFAGDLGEIIVYDQPLTIVDRQRVERYLGSKYRIKVTP